MSLKKALPFTAALLCAATFAQASVTQFTVHNYIGSESNAKFYGNWSSPIPAGGTGNYPISAVIALCKSHNPCKGQIWAETNTAHPIHVGWLQFNTDTGLITNSFTMPSQGYTLTVNGPAEVTIAKS